ncbi:MAG: hypothetical protein IMZ65_00085 [Planctomycetes bacterium]|nr:hypothetical protein [Planctomycetota bacterium]
MTFTFGKPLAHPKAISFADAVRTPTKGFPRVCVFPTDLDQTRTANEANEITGISGTWIDPTYGIRVPRIPSPEFPGNIVGSTHIELTTQQSIPVISVQSLGGQGR